ncbi:MAG: helix-turn-helix domain-containing protein [Pseudonocardia sp.]|nr:helix-turn-helix domain-containing protein [Pseudonocardia sp.]MBO0874275.1 helix-turn-helix domain-containing protein [Pseudonocardia sp.]
MDECDLGPTSTYWEGAPPPEWRHAVYRCWEQRISAGGGGYPQRVLPDGHADVIVFGDGDAILVGPATGVAVPVMPAGSIARGIRLVSDAVRAVLDVPASELTDRTVPLGQLVPGPTARALVDAVGAGDPGARVTVEHWLAHADRDPRVAKAARSLWAEPELEVTAVAERVGLSTRQLRRALLTEVGLGPKTFQRIGRLQRFIALARLGNNGGLAELAASAGYADQPHLTREARALSGLTPTALLADQLVE